MTAKNEAREESVSVRVREAPIISERFISGEFGDFRYDNCLHGTVDEDLIELRPIRLVGRHHHRFILPLNAVTSLLIVPSLLGTTLEFSYAEGMQTKKLLVHPKQPMIWVEFFKRRGIVIRPADLSLDRVPIRCLGYQIRDRLAIIMGAALSAAMLFSIIRGVAG